MAANDPSELISAEQAEETGKVTTRKCFAFDRDDTLIDSKYAPINPESMRLIMKGIIDNPETNTWCIISTGSAGFGAEERDSCLKRFSEVVVDPTATDWAQPNKGAYLEGGRGRGSTEFTLCQRKANLPSNSWAEQEEKKLNQKNCSLATMILIGLVKESEQSLTFSFKVRENTLTTTIPKDATLTLDMNEMEVIIKIEQFVKNRMYHRFGDNKFFQLLSTLAANQIAVVPSDQMKEWGIDIRAPKNFEWIVADNILALDDKPAVVLLLRKAGFNAHRADSSYVLLKDKEYRVELERHLQNGIEEGFGGECKLVIDEAQSILDEGKCADTYLNALIDHLGPELYRAADAADFEIERQKQLEQSKEVLLSFAKNVILERTNEIIKPVIPFTSNDDVSPLNVEGEKRRRLHSFFGNPFERKAAGFLRDIMSANDLDELADILVHARGEHPQAQALFDKLDEFMEKYGISASQRPLSNSPN